MRSLAPYGRSVALTLAAGGVMAIGGYLFNARGWTTAGPSMIPAGPLITIAFLFAPRSDPGQPRPRSWTTARVLLLVLGVPVPTANLSAARSLAVSILTLLAGALSALAGYTLCAHHRVFAVTALLSSGVVIAAAFAAQERSADDKLLNSND